MTAEAALRHATLTPLEGAKYINLTTFRRDGMPVATPVWFAAQDRTVYVYTEERSGKVQRLRRNAQVTLAPCTIHGEETGPTLVATARIIEEPGENRRAIAALAGKYGWQFQVFRGFSAQVNRFRRSPGNRWLYLAITPQP